MLVLHQAQLWVNLFWFIFILLGNDNYQVKLGLDSRKKKKINVHSCYHLRLHLLCLQPEDSDGELMYPVKGSEITFHLCNLSLNFLSPQKAAHLREFLNCPNEYNWKSLRLWKRSNLWAQSTGDGTRASFWSLWFRNLIYYFDLLSEVPSWPGWHGILHTNTALVYFLNGTSLP